MADDPRSIRETVQKGDLLFMRKGPVWESLIRLAESLECEEIPYAVVGGLALISHGFDRFTSDIDIVLTAEALDSFRTALVGRGYAPAFTGARKSFRDTRTNVRIDVITAGEYPGDGLPKQVRFPDPAGATVEIDGLHIITLPRLLELKLASGSSARHRLRDLGDVQQLIEVLKLPEAVADSLDPSVAPLYRELWRQVRDAPEGPHEREP